MKIIKRVLSLIIISIVLINTVSCDAISNKTGDYTRIDEYTRIDFNAFDTVGYITIFEVDDYESYKERENYYTYNIKNILTTLENIYTRTDENSELYKINHRTSNELMITRGLSTLMSSAKLMYEMSLGNFDISIGNLVELWDVKNREIPPSDEEIKEALKYANNMDYEIIEDVDPESMLCDKIVFKNDIKTHYDLGAIAKGYATINIRDLLVDTVGVKSGMINFGGSVTIIGSKDNVPYKIGVKRPFKDGYILTENVINRSLITSGTYERYFEYNDRIYHHIISNKDGYPIDNGITSVTINCENPLMGDFLSTSILILGEEKGKELLEAIKSSFGDNELSAILIDKDENIIRF